MDFYGINWLFGQHLSFQRHNSCIGMNSDSRACPELVSLDREFDVLLEAVADSSRRRLLYYLQQTPTPVELDDCVEHLAAGSPDRTRSQLRADLTEHHLPELDDADLLDYDQRKHLVRESADVDLDALATFVRSVEAA